MSKSLTLLFVLILIALSITLAVLYYAGSQSTPTNNAVTPSSDTVKIVALTPKDYWGNPVGMTMDFWFNVTIRNEGINKIEGVTLNLTITDAASEIYDWGTYAPIGMIQPGETIEVQMYIITGFDNFDKVAGHNADIKLMLADKTIDESSMILPTRAWG
jgi:hypothetical protein